MVDCIVVDLDELHAELAEIDENLIRADLSPAQAAVAIRRRKAIYETLHPETKQHANVGPERQFVVTEAPSFAKATAKATGKSERTVRVAAARAIGSPPSAIAPGGEGSKRPGDEGRHGPALPVRRPFAT